MNFIHARQICMTPNDTNRTVPADRLGLDREAQVRPAGVMVYLVKCRIDRDPLIMMLDPEGNSASADVYGSSGVLVVINTRSLSHFLHQALPPYPIHSIVLRHARTSSTSAVWTYTRTCVRVAARPSHPLCSPRSSH